MKRSIGMLHLRPLLLVGALIFFATLPTGSYGFQHFSTTQNKKTVLPRQSRTQTDSPSSSSLFLVPTDVVSIASSSVNSFFETQPYVAAFLLCSCKGSAADSLAQRMAAAAATKQPPTTTIGNGATETLTDFDLLRNLSFVLYGGLYQGMGQTFLYSNLYPFLFGSEPTIQSILAQASMENFVLAPFVCLPTVYTIKSLLQGSNVQAGLEKYWDHIFSQHVLLKFWSLWFPVACFNFGVIPEHLRVPFGAFVSFFWVCILSTTTAQEKGTLSATNNNSNPIRPPPFANDSSPATCKIPASSSRRGRTSSSQASPRPVMSTVR